jgi:uncharacterized protein YbjT (DUF2867 family)
MASKKVLLVGARGSLGSKVLDCVLEKSKTGGGLGSDGKPKHKYTVVTLIRPGSDAAKVEARGVEVVRGDMMDKASLEAAFQGVDVVINTANGYGQGHPEFDTEGARNVADAVKSAKVGRYVYCSILTCDKAPTVEHFWHKYQGEEYLKEKEVPYIALRPGAFLDQSPDYLADGLVKGSSFTMAFWNKNVPTGMVYSPDLAQYFADAIDIPDDAVGQFIELGWSRPVTYQEIVSICGEKLNRSIRCFALPSFLRTAMIYTVGWFSPFWAEVFNMTHYMDSGAYVNTDLEKQRKYFGEPPTPEDVIGRYVDKVMADKDAADAAAAAAAAAATSPVSN